MLSQPCTLICRGTRFCLQAKKKHRKNRWNIWFKIFDLKSMKKILLIISLFASVPLLAQENPAYTSLEELIAIGMENNFQVRMAKNNQELGDYLYSTGYGVLLPTVDLNGGYNGAARNTYLEQFNGNVVEQAGAQSTNLNADITARWVVFEGFRRFNSLNRFRIEHGQSNLLFKAEMENMISLVSRAYYSYLMEQERLRFLEQSLQLSQQRLDIAQSNYEVGKTSRSEYLAAQVDYNADKSAIYTQQELVNTSRIEINRLLNRDLRTPILVKNDIQINSNLSDTLLIEDALANNTQLRLAQGNAQASYFSLNEQRSTLYPTVSLFGTYAYNRNTAEVGFASLNRATGPQYGLTLSWTLFNGLTQARQTAQMKTQVANLKLQEEENEQQLMATILNVYFNYKNNISLLSLEGENVKFAQENYDLALERYKIGNSSALEIREAQQNALQAEIRYLTAAFQVKLAEIEMQRLSGNLVETKE